MVTHPDPDGGGSLAAPEIDFAYDATTLLMTSTNGSANNQTTFSYNSNTNRLSTITHPDSTTWVLTPAADHGLRQRQRQQPLRPGRRHRPVRRRARQDLEVPDRPLRQHHLFQRPAQQRHHDRTRPRRPADPADPERSRWWRQCDSPITKFGYNSSGDLVKQYLSDASVQTWTYHTTWHLPLTFVNELNKTWTYTYATTAANLLTGQDPLSNTTTLTYTSIGLLDTHTTPDPDGAGSSPPASPTWTTIPTAAWKKSTTPAAAPAPSPIVPPICGSR